MIALNQWFDMSKHIEQSDLNLVIDQMRLYALKQGLDPAHPECNVQCNEMRQAVQEHNKQHPAPATPVYRSRAAKLRAANRKTRKAPTPA
jgi:hypothetical protein